MPLLLGIGLLAGVLTVLSPCILPVLPAVIASGVTSGGRRRAFAIAIGLALAFGLSALFSIRVLHALHLPLGLRYDIAIVVLFVLAAGFLVPRLGALLERPFARLSLGRAATGRGGLLLGASLGLLYLPCGGPILATIAAVGSPQSSVNLDAVLLTAAYSIGIAFPVLLLVLAAGRASRATTWLRVHAVRVRQVGGALLAASAVAITFGAATSLQTAAPSYTASIEQHLTSGHGVQHDLHRISGTGQSAAAQRIQGSIDQPATTTPVTAPMADTVPTIKASLLRNYGPAPAFTGITTWLNTPGGAPLNLASLRGKVVLVDFWTYSCINCLRSLPHLKAWYARYAADGLVVVGVHTPEFDFEHNVGNVRSAVSRLGVKYPVAIDNDYATWSAWGNDSWPAEYLIDQTGHVRYGSIGEGEYGATEAAIRALLAAGHHHLPPTTDVPDATPQQQLTPESYLGYQRLARYAGTPAVKRNAALTYRFPSSLAANHLALAGQWTVHSEDIAAGTGAQLEIHVSAHDVYLVLSGEGTLTGTLNGRPLAAQRVSGVPTLYTVLSGSNVRRGVLRLSLSSGLSAYDFTFG